VFTAPALADAIARGELALNTPLTALLPTAPTPLDNNRLIAAHAGLRGNTLTSRCITVHGDPHASFCCPS
jgi:CubicO group peptidase (beta-lactamase class C family)